MGWGAAGQGDPTDPRWAANKEGAVSSTAGETPYPRVCTRLLVGVPQPSPSAFSYLLGSSWSSGKRSSTGCSSNWCSPSFWGGGKEGPSVTRGRHSPSHKGPNWD